MKIKTLQYLLNDMKFHCWIILIFIYVCLKLLILALSKFRANFLCASYFYGAAEFIYSWTNKFCALIKLILNL